MSGGETAVELFNKLAPKISELGYTIKNKKFSTGETILFAYDDKVHSIYFLEKGSFEVYGISTSGKKIIFDVFMEGDFFMRDSYRKCFIDAKEDSEVAIIPFEMFEVMIRENPNFAIQIIKNLNADIYAAYTKISDIGTADSIYAVAYQMNRLAKKYGKIDRNGNIRVCPKISHETIAEHLGLTRETVTKAMIKLKKLGYITNAKPDSVCKFGHLIINSKKIEQIK